VRPSRLAAVARAVLAQSELARGHDADVWEVLRRAGRTEHPSRLAILNADGAAGGAHYPSALDSLVELPSRLMCLCISLHDHM